MKNFAATIFSIFFFISSLAAQVNTDSLQKVISSSGPYKEKIKAYLAFIQNAGLKNFDTTIGVSYKALELARSNGDSVSVAELKRHVGVAYYFNGRYDIAAKNYYEAVSILEQTNEKKELANVYNEIAKLYRKTRDLDRSLQNYDKAMAIFRQLNDSTGVSMILNESGVVFEYKQDYTEAIRRYEGSLKIAQALKDSVKSI